MNKKHCVWTCCVLATVIVFATTGCGDSSGLSKISGSVTFDGEPIEEGSISFMPAGGKGVAAGGVIKGGKYTAEVSPGELSVQIHGTKTVEKENPTEEEVARGLASEKVEIIPAKYHQESTLKITVAKSGETHDFDLTSDE